MNILSRLSKYRFEIYFRVIWIQTNRIFYFSRRLFAQHHALSSWYRIFSGKSKSSKIRILSISKFLFIVVIVISILLKTVFLQTSIHIQSLMKSLWLSDKDKITFKAIKKKKVWSVKLYWNTLKGLKNVVSVVLLVAFLSCCCRISSKTCLPLKSFWNLR